MNQSIEASPPSMVPLSTLLDNRVQAVGGERISIAEILQLLDDRSIWALLLLLALPMALPIPTPGLSVPFGACMVLISGQLAIGRRYVWLPRKLVRRSVDKVAFARVLNGMLPVLRRLEKIVRPRKKGWAREWMKLPVGIVCLILALIITLPIPLGHVAPGTAIALFSLGMMERDGVTVWTGLAVAVASLVLVVLASASVYGGLNQWWVS